MSIAVDVVTHHVESGLWCERCGTFSAWRASVAIADHDTLRVVAHHDHDGRDQCR